MFILLCLLRQMWMFCLWTIVTFVTYFIGLCIYFVDKIEYSLLNINVLVYVNYLWPLMLLYYLTMLHWGVHVLLSVCTLSPVDKLMLGFCMERSVIWNTMNSTMCWVPKLCILEYYWKKLTQHSISIGYFNRWTHVTTVYSISLLFHKQSKCFHL